MGRPVTPSADRIEEMATGLFWMPAACSAYVSVEIVSSTTARAGEIVAMTTVRQLPPNADCNKRVSFESLYGTRPVFSRSAAITRRSVSKLWLMFFLSRSCSNVQAIAWLALCRDFCVVAGEVANSSAAIAAFLAHSEPARSTKCNLPTVSCSPPAHEHRQMTFIVKMQCDLLLRALIRVSATRRLSWAAQTRRLMSSKDETGTSDSPTQQTPRLPPASSKSNLGWFPMGANKSVSSSL
mmetsp:Transcript_18588/g.53728  ORF Transcript_18588/g.53728 Transcript_18588/m.53728 type:complete len:239 (-) Transcript_18588:559-1275(-)